MAPRPPGRPKGSKTKDPGERRAELVEATIAAVRRVGPDAQMTEIAAEAGITKAVLYDHFEGKDGLRQAVIEHYDQRLLRVITTDLAAERTPREILRDGVTAFVAFVERDRALFRFVTQGQTSLLLEAAPVFSALIGHALRREGKDSGGAIVFATATLGAVFAATEQWAEHPTMSRDDFVDYLTALLWHGLAGVGLSESSGPVDMSPAVRALAAVVADE